MSDLNPFYVLLEQIGELGWISIDSPGLVQIRKAAASPDKSAKLGKKSAKPLAKTTTCGNTTQDSGGASLHIPSSIIC